MKRVYCLYRVSSNSQSDHQNDIEMQKIACRKFAFQKNWLIMEEFFEIGISGYSTNIKDREKIKSILYDAAKGLFDVLLVFMFDRLGRQTKDATAVIAALHYYNIEIWSVQEGLLQKGEGYDLIRYIRFWSAQIESKHISMRVDSKLRQMIVNGHYRGGAVPFGYKVETKEFSGYRFLEHNEEETKIVRQIFNKYSQGQSVTQIIKALTNENIKPKAGGKWYKSSIYAILKNKTYAGYLKYGDLQSARIENVAIVSMDLYNLVQKRLTNQRCSEKIKQELTDYLISCIHCKQPLILSNTSKKNKKKKGKIVFYQKLCYMCGSDSHPKKEKKYYSANEVNEQIEYEIGMFYEAIIKKKQNIINKLKYNRTKLYSLREGAKNRLSQKEVLINDLIIEGITKGKDHQAEISNRIKGYQLDVEEESKSIEKYSKEIVKIGKCIEYLKKDNKIDNMFWRNNLFDDIFIDKRGLRFVDSFIGNILRKEISDSPR